MWDLTIPILLITGSYTSKVTKIGTMQIKAKSASRQGLEILYLKDALYVLDFHCNILLLMIAKHSGFYFNICTEIFYEGRKLLCMVTVQYK
jgi:hypothetical protein